MGLLDDAIREHLELKRKHGAAEEELQRQQEEALGPARRDVAPAEQPDGNGSAEGAEDHPGVEDEEAVVEVPAESPTELTPEPDPALEVAPLEPEAEESALEAPLEEAVADEHSVPLDEPAPAEEPASFEAPAPDAEALEPKADHPPVDPLPAGETPPSFEALDEDEIEDEHEETAEAPGGDEDADVLEDTPEFLQETPEHDRLWFEQKPPRDFDFD